MSDFFTDVSLLRGEVSRMLGTSDEHAMWVLADLTQRAQPQDLAEHVLATDEDPEDVAVFYGRLAAAIRAEIPDDDA